MRGFALALAPLFFGLALSCGSKQPNNAAADAPEPEKPKSSTKAKDDDAESKSTTIKTTEKQIAFTDIKAMIKDKCESCHNEEEIAKKKPKTNFTGFATLRPYGSLLPTVEPFQALTVNEKNAINAWINGGMTQPTYTSSVKPIIDAKCVTCHDADAPNNPGTPKSDLTKDTEIAKYASQMPFVTNFREFTTDEQAKFKKWLEQGMKTK